MTRCNIEILLRVSTVYGIFALSIQLTERARPAVPHEIGLAGFCVQALTRELKP